MEEAAEESFLFGKEGVGFFIEQSADVGSVNGVLVESDEGRGAKATTGAPIRVIYIVLDHRSTIIDHHSDVIGHHSI